MDPLKMSFIEGIRPEPAPSAEPMAEEPREARQLSPLADRLRALQRQAGLPRFSPEEVRKLSILLDPRLKKIAAECIALLRRRPQLGAPLGLSAPWLEELLQTDLELCRLGPIVGDLLWAADNARGALRLSLAAQNARVLLFVAQAIADPQGPLSDRQRLQDQFAGALALAEGDQAQRAAEARRARGMERKAEEYRARIRAAEQSQAVLGARQLLRRRLEKEGDAR